VDNEQEEKKIEKADVKKQCVEGDSLKEGWLSNIKRSESALEEYAKH
jgi:hypothetical protein